MRTPNGKTRKNNQISPKFPKIFLAFSPLLAKKVNNSGTSTQVWRKQTQNIDELGSFFVFFFVFLCKHDTIRNLEQDS